MTELTLHIPSDIENKLRENARKRHESLETYVLELMRNETVRSAPSHTHIPAAEKEKKLKALEEIARLSGQLTTGTPALRDDAVAMSYEEHADRQLSC
jgi:hypothetical protein